MALTMMLYRNQSLPNVINKNLGSTLATLSGQLVEETDDYSSEIRVSCSGDDLDATYGANYFRLVEATNAYYFIDSVEQVRNGLFVIKGHLDVLMTYRDQINNMYILAERSSNLGSTMIDDPYVVEALSKTRLVTLFPKQLDLTENAGAYVMLTSQIGYDA